MIISTTPQLEGHRIQEYCGMVNAEIILGAHVFKDVLAGIRDFVGGRARSYERELRAAREQAMNEIILQAQLLKADAIVGVQIEIEVLGRNGSMMMACAYGTAVRIAAASADA